MRRPLFQGLVSSGVKTEEIDPHACTGRLLAGEKEAVEGAAPTRVEQFTAGRVCARLALSQLGLATTKPIPRGEDRAPIWPEGFVGSISHTDTWCAAAVARAEDLRAIGIDLEPATPLKEALWRRVCTENERDWLHGLAEPGLKGKVLFSAKESVYKCQYPLTMKFLGFHAVQVELGDGTFEATFQQEAGEFQPGDVMSGRFVVEEGLVASACELSR